MIVPTMSPDEICKEILSDYDSVQRKSAANALLLQKQMLRGKKEHEMKALTYKSSRLNLWTLLFRILPNEVHNTSYLESTDSGGNICAYTVFTEKAVVKLNHHFFKRYNERLNLGIENQSEIVKHYFRHNFDFDIGETELLNDGTRLVNSIYEKGIGIGWYDEPRRFYHFKTFLANEMLTEKQTSLLEYLKGNSDADEFTTVIREEHLKRKF